FPQPEVHRPHPRLSYLSIPSSFPSPCQPTLDPALLTPGFRPEGVTEEQCRFVGRLPLPAAVAEQGEEAEKQGGQCPYDQADPPLRHRNTPGRLDRVMSQLPEEDRRQCRT